MPWDSAAVRRGEKERRSVLRAAGRVKLSNQHVSERLQHKRRGMGGVGGVGTVSSVADVGSVESMGGVCVVGAVGGVGNIWWDERGRIWVMLQVSEAHGDGDGEVEMLR